MSVNVPEIFDLLIIESYAELAGVVLGLAVMGVAVRLIWRMLRSRRAVKATKAKPRSSRRQANISATAPRNKSTTGQGLDFEKLATMISVANVQAGHISETQTAAALKLDTAEMAVNRLIAEINGVMTVPAKETPRPVSAATQTPATSQAAGTPRTSLAA